MKANKALKRLAKIEALMSDVTERYSARGPGTRKMLQNAEAAIVRAKAAVNLEASPRPAKTRPVEHSEGPSKPTPEPTKPKRKLVAAGRRASKAALQQRRAQKLADAQRAQRSGKKAIPARKKTVVKKVTAKAKAAKKVAPVKRAAVKRAAVKRVTVKRAVIKQPVVEQALVTTTAPPISAPATSAPPAVEVVG
jgi:hypothetical protein